MNRIVKIILIGLFLVAAAWAITYLMKTNQKENILYETTRAFKTNISTKAVATGSIKAKEDIEIKPNISGIIHEIIAEEGDYVKKGAILARLNVVPSVNNLSNAKSQINTARISLNNVSKNYNRQKALYNEGVISKADYEQAEVSYLNAKESLRAAKENYEIIRTGTSSSFANEANTQIKAKINGMVLDIPVEVGDQVIESNTMNAGTTIAILADVSNMIFEGSVDEAEVGKLKEGMPIKITIGALAGESFEAILYFISPLGVDDNGTVKFEIKANVQLKEGVFIRAGYSANAEIILETVENVLAIKESLLRFEDDGKTYVEISTGNEEKPYEKRYVELGISDGTNVQIKGGISEDDEIKVLNTDLKEGQRKRH
ncbi:MAG: efflux RND transporter periplasmic adaptor subunit [Flavobacteriales bacterium]